MVHHKFPQKKPAVSIHDPCALAFGDAAAFIGQELGFTSQLSPTDNDEADLDLGDDLDTVREVWLHLLMGLHNGHVLAALDNKTPANRLIAPNSWPDATDITARDKTTFRKLQRAGALRFSFARNTGTLHLGQADISRCPFQLHHPSVFVVQSTEMRVSGDLARSLNHSMDRRIFVQR